MNFSHFLTVRMEVYIKHLTEYTIVMSCRFHSNLHAALLESKKTPTTAA